MISLSSLAGTVAALGLLLAVTGCGTTSYGPYEQQRASVPLIERRVAFRLDDAFYRDPPPCAVILPAKAAPSPRVAGFIEDALSRHLSLRLPRVIGRLERRRQARELGVDLSDKRGRETFARMTDCPAAVEAALFSTSDDYLLVWAHRSIGLEVTLNRTSDDTELWKARHQGIRTEGGLPLSPVSAAVSGFNATRFHRDDDVTPSLVDDVVRRIVASLPDTR